MTSYWLCLQDIGLRQYENQHVSRPNHDFCHFVADFEKFFVLGWLECLQFNVLVLLSLTHVIANCLNSKYLSRAVIAEWFTHADQGVGDTRFEPLQPSILNFPPLDDNVCLGSFFTCYSQRVEDNRIRRNSQLYCLH